MHTQSVSRSVSKVKANPRPCECGDHVWDVATKGYVVLVSPVDAGNLSRKWAARDNGFGHFYAQMKGIGMLHRVILKLKLGEFGDHENANGMDCRRRNIKPCTRSQNQMNSRISGRSKIGLKGVWRTPNGRYCGRIKINGKRVHLGVFDTAVLAHEAYCEAARKAFGDFFNPG